MTTTPRQPNARPAAPAYPLVSVVLATRGRPELLRKALDSIISQTYLGRIECLVVHDREDPDQTLVRWATETRHVQVMTNTHAAGLPGARNTGLDAASGAFIATCDDDDTWHQTKLQKQIDRLQSQPDLLAVGAGIRLILPESRIVEWPGKSDRVTLGHLTRNRIKELHSSTLVMRSDAYAKAGRYDEHIPHGYAEDYDFVLRLARVGHIGVIREPLADIRKDIQSWFRERSSNTAEALEYMLDKHPALRADRRGHARILGQIAFAQASLGQRGIALKTVGRALTRYPLAPHAFVAIFQILTGTEPIRLLRTARLRGRGLS